MCPNSFMSLHLIITALGINLSWNCVIIIVIEGRILAEFTKVAGYHRKAGSVYRVREFSTATEVLAKHLEECLTFYRFPERHWSMSP